VLAAVRRELEKREVLKRGSGGLTLTDKGREFVEQFLGIESRHNAICPACEGRRIVIHDGLRPALEKLDRYFQARPRIDTSLDQAPCLPKTSLRRALYMYQSGALEGKSVIVVGDDDSVSLAVGLLGQWLRSGEFCKRITVLDADPRILEHLQSAARVEGFPIECIRYDLRTSLPAGLRGQFDTFATDPPYTSDGAALFLSRSVSALKGGSGRQGFLCFGPKSPAETLELHRRILALHLAVDEIIPSFNEYAGASVIGSSSQLIHLLSTASTAAMFADERFVEKIYTGEVRPTVRLYRCLRCRKNVTVGQGQRFATIELLKTAGCPHCGNKNFRFKRRTAKET
jgi:predicted methyltransferase